MSHPVLHKESNAEFLLCDECLCWDSGMDPGIPAEVPSNEFCKKPRTK